MTGDKVPMATRSAACAGVERAAHAAAATVSNVLEKAMVDILRLRAYG